MITPEQCAVSARYFGSEAWFYANQGNTVAAEAYAECYRNAERAGMVSLSTEYLENISAHKAFCIACLRYDFRELVKAEQYRWELAR